MTSAPGPKRRVRGVVLIAAGCCLLILTLFGAVAHRSPIVSGSAGPGGSSTAQPTSSMTASPSDVVTPTEPPTASSPGVSILAVLGVIVIVLLVALTIAILVLGVGPLRSMLPGLGPPSATPVPSAVGRPAVAASVADALPELLRAVEARSPRAGIIAAWVRLQEIAIAAGIALQASETPAERTMRMLNGLDVPGRWVLRLAELYREARFSDHPMSEADREEAVACLGAVASSATDRSSQMTPR